MTPQILVTGSLAFDHIMSMPGRFSDHIMPDKLHILNVSFIMKTFRQEFGGTAGNISYSLGLLHTPNILLAAAGGDFGPYKKHLGASKFIKIRVRVFKKEQTSRGFVITDKDDNQIWGFYDGAMRFSDKLVSGSYPKGDIWMIAPNSPDAMEKFVKDAIALNKSYVFDPAFNIPHFSLTSLSKAVFRSSVLIGNDYEITLIKRRLKLTSEGLLGKCKIIITTKGPEGSLIQSKAGNINIPSAKPQNDSDPTGAGDAYRAGFLAGFVRHLPLDVCGKMGAVASVYTVEKYGTQTHRYSLKNFIKRYQENFGKEKALLSLG